MESTKRSIKNSYIYTYCSFVVLCLLSALFLLGCPQIPEGAIDADVDVPVKVDVPILSPGVNYNPSTTTSAELSGGQDAETGGWNIGSIQVNGSAPLLLLGLVAFGILWWMRKKGLINKKIANLLIESFVKEDSVEDIQLKALSREIEPHLYKRVKRVKKKLAKEAKQNGKTEISK